LPPTIRDVARRLNLSITTVSRALDGYTDVAEETRRRVIETAQEMGYAPNRAARQLRRQRADTIGYVVPSNGLPFTDPFFAEFIAGLGDETAHNGFDLLITTAVEATTDRLIYERWVHSRKVDGFILNRLHLYDWRVQFLAQQNMPFVALERSLDAVNYPGIDVDNRECMRELVEFLAAKGRRRIAYIGSSEDLVIQAERFEGDRQGLQSAGLEFDPQRVDTCNLTRQGGYQAARRLLTLTEQPDAVVCINDLTAFGVIHAAEERGLAVGHDLAVTGFDGVEESENQHPPLTTLNQPVYEIARRLVRMLLAVMHGETLEPPRVRLRPERVLRASTG